MRRRILPIAAALLCCAAAPVDLSLPRSALPPPAPTSPSTSTGGTGKSAPASRPAGKLFGRGEPSRVIYPDQKLPLRFSHAQHLAMGKQCDFCHEKAATSVSTRDNLMPKEEVCETCHNIDHEEPFKKTKVASACVACHPSFPAQAGQGVPEPGPGLEALVQRVVLPAANLKFNHQIHITQKIACERCHGDMSRVDLATRAQLPRMALCLSCHNDGLGAREAGKRKSASPRCGTCHLMQPDGTVQVHYESGTLIPSGTWRGDAHGLDFKREHASVGRSDQAYCQSCHRQEWCQSCHNGIVKPMDFHGNDYVSRHPIEARRNDPDCGSCHRRQTFCMGCHERLGVVDRHTLPGNPPPSAFWPSTPRRFHPDGWASPVAGAGHHAWEAQRNIRACVSCHREESCMQCHTSLPGGRMPGGGAAGVNPHPIGWADSARCSALADRNPRMCLKCHSAESPQTRCGK